MIRNPYYSITIPSGCPGHARDNGPTRIVAGYRKDVDAHMVGLLTRAGGPNFSATPAEALQIAAALVLAANAAIEKDNS